MNSEAFISVHHTKEDCQLPVPFILVPENMKPQANKMLKIKIVKKMRDHVKFKALMIYSNFIK